MCSGPRGDGTLTCTAAMTPSSGAVALRAPAGVSYSSPDLPCANAQDASAGVGSEKVDSCICQLLLFLAGMLHVSMRT